MCRVHWRPFRISFAPLDMRQLLLIAGKARRDQAHQLLDADRDIALVEELGNLGLGHALLHCFHRRALNDVGKQSRRRTI